MEKRHEPRLPANQPAVVTALGKKDQGPMGGMVQDMSGGGMLMKLPEAVPLGTLVRIETSDMLLLGEAIRCETAGGEFRVAIKVRHSLRGLQDLVNLNRALLGTMEAGTGEAARAEARTGPGRPSNRSETRDDSAERGSVVRASSSKEAPVEAAIPIMRE